VSYNALNAVQIRPQLREKKHPPLFLNGFDNLSVSIFTLPDDSFWKKKSLNVLQYNGQ